MATTVITDRFERDVQRRVEEGVFCLRRGWLRARLRAGRAWLRGSPRP
ncbi:hypothetical protein [Streptomyces sp. NBC_00083]|nr:hypothetical protein [Streptomyces sp. NBC_00083]MCX5386447.1 hypothetical protein [Streptomyces sp. NBC_00083]